MAIFRFYDDRSFGRQVHKTLCTVYCLYFSTVACGDHVGSGCANDARNSCPDPMVLFQRRVHVDANVDDVIAADAHATVVSERISMNGGDKYEGDKIRGENNDVGPNGTNDDPSLIIGQDALAEESDANKMGFNVKPETALGRVAASIVGNWSDDISGVMQQHVQGRHTWGQQQSFANFTGTLFYPFGGVDALTAVPLFANARSIVIVALHKVGDCQPLTWDDLPKRNAMFTARMNENFRDHGYFTTFDMQQHFDDTGLGVVPFLFASLYLLGREPISIECGPGIGPRGSDLGLAGGDVLRILHRPRNLSLLSTNQTQELIYVRQDLLTPSPVLNRFLDTLRSQAPIATLMKATGYVTRRKQDNQVNRRNVSLDSGPLQTLILQASQIIVQDDTGVRTACLGSWDKKLFGKYVGPATLADNPIDWTSDYDDALHAMSCNGTATYSTLPIHFGYFTFLTINTCPLAPKKCGETFSHDLTPGPVDASTGFALVATRNFSNKAE